MLTDNVTAYAEICDRVKDCVRSDAMKDIVGDTPELRYGDKTYGDSPSNKIWLRVTVVEQGETGRTLSRPARVTYSGVVSVQIFVPFSDREAAFRSRQIADLVKGCLIANTDGVVFNKAGIRDMSPDGSRLYKRVTANYVYRRLV